jgi:hypothetical protein
MRAGQQDGIRAALFIDERVDFRCETGASGRSPDFAPLFAPFSEQRALTADSRSSVSARSDRHIRREPQISAARDSFCCLGGPIEDRCTWPVFVSRHRSPLAAFAQAMDDPTEDLLVVLALVSGVNQKVFKTNQSLLWSLNRTTKSSSIGTDLRLGIARLALERPYTLHRCGAPDSDLRHTLSPSDARLNRSHKKSFKQ